MDSTLRHCRILLLLFDGFLQGPKVREKSSRDGIGSLQCKHQQKSHGIMGYFWPGTLLELPPMPARKPCDGQDVWKSNQWCIY